MACDLLCLQGIAWEAGEGTEEESEKRDKALPWNRHPLSTESGHGIIRVMA